jgi:4-hydroxybenzoate polyprenyltransferase
MWRYGVTAIIALGAVWLGVVALRRGQFWIGVCLIGIAILRAVAVLSKRRTPEDPRVRLNLDDPHDGDPKQDVNGQE